MADLIDREATLKKMCEICNFHTSPDFVCRKCNVYEMIAAQPTIEADIYRAAIMRMLHGIEADATTIAYLSDNQQVFDCSHAILDRVELIGKELTGDANT